MAWRRRRRRRRCVAVLLQANEHIASVEVYFSLSLFSTLYFKYFSLCSTLAYLDQSSQRREIQTDGLTSDTGGAEISAFSFWTFVISFTLPSLHCFPNPHPSRPRPLPRTTKNTSHVAFVESRATWQIFPGTRNDDPKSCRLMNGMNQWRGRGTLHICIQSLTFRGTNYGHLRRRRK